MKLLGEKNIYCLELELSIQRGSTSRHSWDSGRRTGAQCTLSIYLLFRAGAKYTEGEYQQALMGLRKENRVTVDRMRKEQDEAIFKVKLLLVGMLNNRNV